MAWQLTPYLPVLFGAVVISSSIVLYAFLRVSLDRLTPPLAAVIAFLLGSAEWGLAAGYQLSNTGAEKALWFRLSSLGAVLVVLSWFVFAAAATDRERWLSGTRLGPLVVAGVVGVALHLTNPLHGWLWAEPVIVSNGSFLVARFPFEPLYFLLAGLAGAVSVGGLWMLLAEARDDPAVNRPLTAVICGSVVVSLAAAVKYHARIGPDPLVNLTPVAVTVTGVVLAYAVFRDRYFDAVPVARSTVFDVMTEGMLVLDRDDRIEDINRAAQDMLGVTESVRGDAATAVVPDAAERFDAHDGSDEFQWTATVEAGGDVRHLQFQTSRLAGDHHGRVVLVSDVSEQHRIEQRYQSLFEEASETITVVDEDGIVTYVSPSVEELLGNPPETYVGESVFDFLGADERDEKEAEFKRVLADPDYTPRIEYEGETAGGETRVFEADVHNMLDNPYVDGVAIISRDVTERKERERALERANSRLEEFASILSHDLRNPLEVAQIQTTLARRGDEAAFEKVQQAHRRIDEMIDDILTLTRDGLDVEELAAVSLDAVATDAWASVRTTDATLSVADDVAVEADRNRLLQLLENLFRNAVEHGGESVTVTVEPTSDGLAVEDDGGGFDAEEPASVFEHGYSTSTEGTGLGLTIVQRIAEAHGWSIRAVDGDDGGARFEITGMSFADRGNERPVESEDERPVESGESTGGAE